MKGQFDRTIGLIGDNALEKLQKSKVAVIGLGGVGSYSAEALARSGVGSLVIADCDVISPSNINRQLPALNSTVEKDKVQVVKDRVLDINPQLMIDIISDRISETTSEDLFIGCDYIIDAIDDVNAKVYLIKTAKKLNIPIISSMGTGNKLNISDLKIADIFKTSVCPLCKVMRKRLRDENIDSLDVVYSEELPKECTFDEEGRRVPSSMIFVPAAAGLLLAETVVKRLIK